MLIKKYLLVGAYGEGNFGDDILMLAYYHLLKEILGIPECDIFVLTRGKNKNLMGIPDTQVVLQNSIGIIYAEYLIYGGGTQFFSFISKKTKDKNIIIKLYNRLKQKIIFRNEIIMLNVGLGPFEIPASNRVKNRINLSKFISVRDEVSLKISTSFTDRYVCYGADVGYIPEYYSNFCLKNENKDELKNGDLEALVVLRDWPDFNYKYFIENIIEISKKLKIKLNFCSFSSLGDLEYIKNVNDFGFTPLIWDGKNVDNFLSKIKDFNFIITSRYHAVVIGAILSIPSIAIAIEPKLSEVIRQVGLQYVINNNNEGFKSMISVFDDFIKDLPNTGNILEQAVKAEENRFREVVESLKKLDN